jgi:chorismate mutase
MIQFPQNICSLNTFLSSKQQPLLIAGPCSAESEEQVLQTARELAKLPQVSAFRCGIWKPRTRPGDFEGIGEEALNWLERAKAEIRLPICVEVAMPSHVEACLEHGIDILWLGSRTVVNPFSVNEIAEALKGVDIPVLVKNPVNPDLMLWVGALERLYQQGIRKLAAVHRGFSAYASHPYRNVPLWEIPIELRRLFPGLPVLVDPSHIAGNRGLVQEVSQTAMNLAFDGLMVESHIRPEEALTDSDQQVTPAELGRIVASLGIPDRSAGNEDDILRQFRSQIDRIDDQVLQLLAQRFEIASRIGKHKHSKGMDLLQLERWKQVVEDRLQKGTALGLSREFLLNLLKVLHEEALKRQS